MTPAALSGALRALHARLVPGGRLSWEGPPTQSRALRAALPEAGFVIERRTLDGPAGAEILVARPDRFVVRGYDEGDEDVLGLGHGVKQAAARLPPW